MNRNDIETEKGEVNGMEYNVNKGEIAVNETVLKTSSEHPIDIDFILPDYCPDIQKILKCGVYPVVTSRSLSGDRLDIEGVVQIKLLYLDTSKKNIRCCEYSSQFSHSFNLKKSSQNTMNSMIFVKAQLDYVNCRAISPRKLDVHGAFSLFAEVLCKSVQEVVTGIDDASVEQKKKLVSVSNIAGQAQQQFSVNEVLELSNGKPNVESIVRTDIIATVQDIKTVANKLIVKGEALIKLLYMGNIENSEMEVMEYSIPISQIIDVEGVDADDTNSINDARLDVLNSNVQIRTDSSGEDSLIEVDIKLLATITSYTENDIQIVADAYSRDYEIELDYKTNTFDKLIEVVKDEYSHKSDLNVNDISINKVIDIWNELSSVSAKKDGNCILFSGKFNVCILAINSEEEPVYIEKMVDFEHSYDMQQLPPQVKCDSDMLILSLSYRITGSNGIEVKAQIKLRACVYQTGNYKSICYASCDENKPRKQTHDASLIIYYGDKGESIWDIARKYCTCVDYIMNENNLNDEFLSERTMLMIPMSG